MIKTVSREAALDLVASGGRILVYHTDGTCDVEVEGDAPAMPEVVEDTTDEGEDEAEKEAE